MSTFRTNPEVINLEDNDGENRNAPQSDSINADDIANKVSLAHDNVIDHDIIETDYTRTMDSTSKKVTYRDVLEVATDLCRTVSDDPQLCKSTYATISEWISRLRQGNDFEVAFHNKSLPHTSNSSKRQTPLPSVITPVGGSKKTRKRYKSSTEIRRRNYKSQRTQSSDDENDDIIVGTSTLTGKNSNNIDSNYTTPGMAERKYCFLCRQPKCTRWTCAILQSYEKVPGRILPKGNQELRDKLVTLISNVDNHVICHNRNSDDARVVYDEFPKKIKALIVIKKFIMEDDVQHRSPHDNVCLECTLLGDLGEPMAMYTEALFKKHCVMRYIGKSKNNLVVDNLS